MVPLAGRAIDASQGTVDAEESSGAPPLLPLPPDEEAPEELPDASSPLGGVKGGAALDDELHAKPKAAAVTVTAAMANSLFKGRGIDTLRQTT